MVGWLCLMSHRQPGHLDTAPPFTVPCEGHEAHFYTVPIENRTLGCRVAVHYTTAAPSQLTEGLHLNIGKKSYMYIQDLHCYIPSMWFNLGF